MLPCLAFAAVLPLVGAWIVFVMMVEAFIQGLVEFLQALMIICAVVVCIIALCFGLTVVLCCWMEQEQSKNNMTDRRIRHDGAPTAPLESAIVMEGWTDQPAVSIDQRFRRDKRHHEGWFKVSPLTELEIILPPSNSTATRCAGHYDDYEILRPPPINPHYCPPPPPRKDGSSNTATSVYDQEWAFSLLAAWVATVCVGICISSFVSFVKQDGFKYSIYDTTTTESTVSSWEHAPFAPKSSCYVPARYFDDSYTSSSSSSSGISTSLYEEWLYYLVSLISPYVEEVKEAFRAVFVDDYANILLGVQALLPMQHSSPLVA